MKNYLPFGELLTAVITPFKNNRIDLDAFEKIIKFQLNSHSVDGLVLFGTTGEPLSLSLNEKKQLFYTAKEILNNRLPIVTGISEPVTKNAIEYAKIFNTWKSDALLVISPYYYITTSSGIYCHFKNISESTNLPVLLYNVPVRTNCDFCKDNNLLKMLAKIPNICAIKQCSSDIKSIKNALSISDFKIFCGNDNQSLYYLLNGAYGCVSVLSQVIPTKFKALITECKNGKKSQAEKTFASIAHLVKLISSAPNPITIKYMLSQILGFSDEMRLPFVTLDENIKNDINLFIKNNKELFI